MTTPPTSQQLDEIEAKAAELRERLDRKNPWPSDNESYWTAEGWKAGTRNALDKLHVEALLAEVRRLTAELADQADADTVASRAAKVISDMGAEVRALTQERNRYRSAWHNARARAVDARDDVEFVERLTARTLTEGEYNAAWHAVEGAAGEEGADPGTILHAVLDRLGIALPAEETHIVADDSDDPEHVDDCPGCPAP